MSVTVSDGGVEVVGIAAVTGDFACAGGVLLEVASLVSFSSSSSEDPKRSPMPPSSSSAFFFVFFVLVPSVACLLP